MRSETWVPLVLLVGYGVGFAARALGVGPLAFDDHPGQLARLVHVVREGPAPWAWHAGWWGGYPEMQFYPPGWFYLGAIPCWLSLGAISPAAAYQSLLWVTYLAPGVSAYLLLRRLLGDGWAPLPGAFVVLTFTGDPAGGGASGVEGGVHIGMVAARLAWALLPCLALSLVPWATGGGRFPRTAVLVLTAIVLVHPAHALAGVAVLAGAAVVAPVPLALARAAGASLAAMLLAAFWLAPLLGRLHETRALAWGALPGSVATTPLAAVLVALAVLASVRRRDTAWTALVHALALGVSAVAAVALVLEPLGVRLLPADRVADGAFMLLLIVAGLGLGIVSRSLEPRLSSPITMVAVIAVVIVVSLPGRTLALWPRAADWPDQASVSRGVQLDALWRVLREAPPGRVLFIRSGVPLVYGTEWYRPHTHVTALAPLLSGRDIIGGTFTHPSPMAAFVYRGDAGPAPLTRLAEQLDGHSLFGRALATLDAETFTAHAERLRVAAVVGLEEDAGHLGFLPESRYRHRVVPPFLVWLARDAPPSIRRLERSRWSAALSGASGWRAAGVAYSPLWRAEHGGTRLIVRRGAIGDLEVQAPGEARSVELAYGPGALELAALAASSLGLAALIADRLRHSLVRP